VIYKRGVVIDWDGEYAALADAPGYPIAYMFPRTAPDLMNLRTIWAWHLRLAVRDRATTLEYLPGRPSDGNLWYVVAGTRYEMVPLPDNYTTAYAEAARSLLMPGRWATLRWRLGGLFGSRAAVGVFGYSINGNVSRWIGRVWQVGGRQGVDFRRLDDPAREATVVEPPWWD